MAEAALSCPVCFTAFAASEGSAFALHVSSCSSTSPPASPTVPSHCPLCFHVYASGTLAHEISFHEHECGRVNDLQEDEQQGEEDQGATNTQDSRKAKRPRNARSSSSSAAAAVTLFPSTCFLCGNGGRGLLRCGGSCARAAHQHCVDDLQAPAAGDPLSVAEKKQAQEKWRCAQCVRGLHRCQRCGFLGHESNGMRKCSVVNCGYFFHSQCSSTEQREQDQQDQQQDQVHAGCVCPRHSCVTCGIQETDMRRCKSCTVCFTMTHLRCPRGTGGATASQTPAEASSLDPGNLFVCPRHDDDATLSPNRSPDASNSLRWRLTPGDVVLILEFNNALLPPSARKAAPDAANHWGVVTAAEETEPLGRGNQLLSVRTFADESVLVVPNRYVLRVASADDFPLPVDLIRHCLQRHAMAELQLRHQEGDVVDTATNNILRASIAAFTARLKALDISEVAAMSDAEIGLARWRRFQALPAPRQYDGLGDSAPIYLYVDTRRSHPHTQTGNSTNASETVADGGGDVHMADADADTTPGAANARGSGGPWANASGPHSTNDRHGPHDANESQATTTKCDEDVTVVMLRDASTTESLPAVTPTNNKKIDDQRMQALAQVVVSAADSTPSTQDTEMQSTQGTQQDSDQQSQMTQTSFADEAVAVSTNVMSNSNKRPADIYIAFENVKRQKTSPTITTGAATTPSMHGLMVTPGATSSGASHISPVAGVARTKQQADQTKTLPKRQHLTRKQKLLAEMPPMVLAELEREAKAYLDSADGSKPLQPARVPDDVDAFPWAARAAQFRPAFYRPTVMLGHSGLRQSGVEAVSRLLVSQDKRSIKCFVHTVDEGAVVSLACPHVNKELSSASPAFVMLDLVSLHSFRELETVVRMRLVGALGQRTRYTREIFGMEAHQAQRWLEQQRRKKPRDQPPLSIWYCTTHGSRCRIELNQQVSVQAWLCFCANVHHLSVMISLPSLEASSATAISTQPQQVSVAGSAK